MNPNSAIKSNKIHSYKSTRGSFYALQVILSIILFLIGSALTLVSLPFELFRHIVLLDLAIYTGTIILGIHLYVQSIFKNGFMKGYEKGHETQSTPILHSQEVIKTDIFNYPIAPTSTFSTPTIN